VLKLFGKISRAFVNELKFRFYTMVFTQWFHKIIMHRSLKLKWELESLSRTRAIETNGCGFAKLGPFHRSLQKLITTKIINNYIRWAQAPISSKPMLCTVDVPWFLRMEGQRSCRSPSFSLHHVCQKSKPQLATKHGFFNGIDCAYIACRRPSIPCFSEA
jgi:hypothetical protein